MTGVSSGLGRSFSVR
uniref:Uncharacterized protein n=1 Tax=Arundo donax TaxID=35708 RepID=A0A0A9TNR3_ARUDO